MTGPTSTQTVEKAEIERLFAEAAKSPRKRSHLLLHEGHHDQVQRLLIAAQPGTYVRPHQHTKQWEMLTLLRGRVEVLIFDEQTILTRRMVLDSSSPVAQIAQSAWHGCLIKAPDTIVLEVKPGPYQPNEFAPWAPEEGTAEAAALFSRMQTMRIGEAAAAR